MKKICFMLLFLTGCTRNACEIAIDNVQPVQKIPKVAKIQIGDKIMADEGGNIMLKNYVNMSTQINSVIDSCQTKK